MASELLSRIRIILVEPEHAGNIGSAARAMKTMGLSNLFLIGPKPDWKTDQAQAMAHNATELLESAQIADSLTTAISDTVGCVATTNRVRRQHAPFLTPPQAADWLLDRATTGPVALVFGRESTGLTNAELDGCSIISTVPAATEVPSLNLAQAVMVYAYELFQASLSPAAREYPWQPIPQAEREAFFRRLTQRLEQQRVPAASTIEDYVSRFRRLFQRLPLESRDLRLLYNLFLDGPRSGRIQEDRSRQSDRDPREG